MNFQAQLQTAFWETVSNALEETNSDADLRTAVFIGSQDWEKLSEIARLRTENRLIDSIKEGEYNSVTENCPKGSLGTWATGITKNFALQVELKLALTEKVLSGGQLGVDYVLRYFRADLLDSKSPPSSLLSLALRQRLDADDASIYEALWFVKEGSCEEGWLNALGPRIEKYSERNPGIPDDDIPF